MSSTRQVGFPITCLWLKAILVRHLQAVRLRLCFAVLPAAGPHPRHTRTTGTRSEACNAGDGARCRRPFAGRRCSDRRGDPLGDAVMLQNLDRIGIGHKRRSSEEKKFGNRWQPSTSWNCFFF